MMFREQQPVRGVPDSEASQLAAEQLLLKQLLANPQRHGHREAAIAAGCKGEVRLEQPLELEERLLVERHVIHVIRRDARVLEAERGGVGRKPRVMLLPRKSFLLRSGNDPSVGHERGSAVVVVRGKTQDPH
jgi:hypothetical protein